MRESEGVRCVEDFCGPDGSDKNSGASERLGRENPSRFRCAPTGDSDGAALIKTPALEVAAAVRARRTAGLRYRCFSAIYRAVCALLRFLKRLFARRL